MRLASLSLRLSILAVLALITTSCALFKPAPGTVLETTKVRQLSDGEVRVSTYSQVMQDESDFYRHRIWCRLDQANFDLYAKVKLKIEKDPGIDLYDTYQRSDIGKWKICYPYRGSYHDGFYRKPWRLLKINETTRVGCVAHPKGLGLADGSRIVGTICNQHLREGVRLYPDGRVSQCTTVKESRPYYDSPHVTDTRSLVQCLETDAAGVAKAVTHYEDNENPALRDVDGPQITFKENGRTSYSYFYDGKRKRHEPVVAKGARVGLEREHEKARKMVAAKYDPVIDSAERSLKAIRSSGSALSRVKSIYGKGDPIDKCGCVWASCLKLIRPGDRDRTEAQKAAAKRREKARKTMCYALRRAGIIEVDGLGHVTAARGMSGLNIETALASVNFSKLNVTGEAADMLRDAQKQLREADRLEREAEAKRAAKKKALAELKAQQEREAKEKAEEAVRAERRRIGELARRAEARLEKYKACVAGYGLRWEEREQWSVVPADC